MSSPFSISRLLDAKDSARKCFDIIAISALLVMVSSGAALANWQFYYKDRSVVASVNYLSYEPFRGQPSVWIRWHYVVPKKGKGGEDIHITANCSEHRLFEISSNPYDAKGNFLPTENHQASPKEFRTKGPLFESTYNLLCRRTPKSLP